MPLLKTVIYLAVLGILAHFIGEALPRSSFKPEQAPFACCAWERGGRIYERIAIQKWKDHMPDMSRIMKDMMPKRIDGRASSDSVYRLAVETCVAESVHWALCALAFGAGVFWTGSGRWLVPAIIIACNLPFILIQRYNRPKLIALSQRLHKREEKHLHEGTDTVV